jgi:zinc transport system ATP-binding protein
MMVGTPRENAVNDPPVIELNDVWFSYDGPPVLEAVNLHIHEGDFACMVGPNGGGKTTLLKLMLGLLLPTHGSVRVFGAAPHHARRRIGYAPQQSQFDPRFPASVMDIALTGRMGRTRLFGPYARSDKRAAARALEEVGCYDLRKQAFPSLSGGQRQRVLIARALASEPELLLLDEPTANLDIKVEGEFQELLRELSKRLTIVLVSHDVGFVAQFVKTVVCVRHRVSVHPTSQLTGELVSELYGQEVRMIQHSHDCLEGRK